MTGPSLQGQNRSSLRARWVGFSRRLPRRQALLAGGLVALLGGLVVLYIATFKQVQINVDGQAVTLRTHARTVADALAQAKIKLASVDEVQPGLAESLPHRAELKVLRAVPLKLTMDGESRTVETTAATVGAALQGAGVTLDGNVLVTPEPTAPVVAGMEVTVKKVTLVTQVVEESIPFETVRREDGALELGQERLVQSGQNGLRQVTVRKTLEDGQMVKSDVLDTKVVRPPQPKVVAFGTVGQISRGGQTIRFRKALTMTATGYTAGTESNPWATGYTYLGMKATRGVVAVDPKVIPLRSRLYIEGYGFAIAADIGGAIKGNRIDLCFDTTKEADDYGLRRGIKVYILE